MQASIQVTTVAVRAMREADPPAKPHTRRSIPEEQYRLRQTGRYAESAKIQQEGTR